MNEKQRVEFEARQEKIDEKANQGSNLDIGDFLGEVCTAIRYKERFGLEQGDYLEEVERFHTDRAIFGEEVRSKADVKLQIALCLDASVSMWMNQIMEWAGPACIGIDKLIRQTSLEMPEGSIIYAPFIWAFGIKRSMYDAYGNKQKVDESGKIAYKADAKELKRFEGVKSMPGWAGTDTYIAPLFRAIQNWENTESDPTAHRLDIILTDGVLEHREDVKEATRIQDARNGRLTTIMLNFLHPSEWGSYVLPDRCVQYPVKPTNLGSVLRDVIMAHVAEAAI